MAVVSQENARLGYLLDDRDVKALARALEKVSAHARPLRPGRIAK